MQWKYTAYPLSKIFTSNSSAVRLMLTKNWDSEGPDFEEIEVLGLRIPCL